MGEVRYRIYPVQIHMFCQKCAVKLGSDGYEMTDCIEMDHDGTKYVGEMLPQPLVYLGPPQEFPHKCTNPACDNEQVFPYQYPRQEQVEGRVVYNPGELSQNDTVIKQKLSQHVGSAIVPDAIKKDNSKD